MTSRTLILFIFLILITLNCDKEKPVPCPVMPPVNGATLQFRGYVTNAQFELVSQLYHFNRTYVGSDTIEGRAVHIYVSNNQRIPFYTDEKGSVWQYQTEDLSARLVTYGLTTEKPVILQFWEQLLKIDKGRNSRWKVLIDTTFEAYDSEGRRQEIQYSHYGEARYDGWSNVTVPERKNAPYRVMNAFYPVVTTYIINRSTGDSLFVSRGKARQLFEPMLGAIRYITDFTMREKDSPPVFRRGTWELTSTYIPQNE